MRLNSESLSMEETKYSKTNTIRDYISIVFRRKGVIISVFLIMMLTVFIGLQLRTPIYDAKVKMLILATKQIDSPYYKSNPSSHYTEMTSTQSEIVRSTPVIDLVVKTLRLNEQPLDYEKKFCSPLKAILVDLKLKMFNANLERIAPDRREQVIFAKAIRDLKERIKVEPVKDTSIFTITVTDYDPQSAAKLANTVSRSYCIFDLQQQLSELEQRYGQRHISIIQLRTEIEDMKEQLTRGSLTNFEAIGPASVKVIEQASVPIEPLGTRKIFILLTTLLLSLMLGFVLAFWVEFFDSTIKTPLDIVSLGLKPLGYLPKRNNFLTTFLLLIRKLITITCLILGTLIILRIFSNITNLAPENPIIKFIHDFTEPILFFNNSHKFNLNIILTLIFFAAIALNIIISKLNKTDKKNKYP
jgi:uncharacterized protein involved in exopolysaccharide biosynthesis